MLARTSSSSSAASASRSSALRASPTAYSAFMRVKPTSTSRFARSVPNARKRPVESSKSNGSGKGSSDIAERVVAFERHSLLLEIVGEARAREDAVRRERRAAVGPAVADEDERMSIRQRAALALVAAVLADALVVEDHAPSVRPHLGVVRARLDVAALALDHREDH